MFQNETSTASKRARHAFLIGIDLLSVVATTLVVVSMLLLLGFSEWQYGLLMALGVTAYVAWYGVSRLFAAHRVRIWVRHLAVVTLLLIAALGVAGLSIDTTVDGQAYHAETISALVKGWNPYRSNAPDGGAYTEFSGFFSKGPWVTAAAIYRLTGNVESGKAFSLVLIFASFAIAYATFLTQPKLRAKDVVLLSFLMAFNPVSVYQLFSFYNDGQLTSCLTILVCLLLLSARQFDRLLLVGLTMIVVLIPNVKLNGTVYMAVLLGGDVVWLLVQQREERWRVIGTLAVAGLFAVGFVGYNPYISQYVRQFIATGNPFYPTQWYNLIHMDANTPPNLLNQDRLTRLGMSIFAQSKIYLEPATLKVPFMVYPQELMAFRYQDTRLSGFGPLFSGAFSLAAIILFITAWRKKHVLVSIRGNVLQFVRNIPFPLLLGSLVALSVVVSDQGWWARYAPQLWVLPILTAAFALTSRICPNWLVRGLVFTLFINIVLVGSTYLALGVYDQAGIRQELTQLHAQSLIARLEMNLRQMPMTQLRFDQWQIAYHITDTTPDCPPGQSVREVLFSWSQICADN